MELRTFIIIITCPLPQQDPILIHVLISNFVRVLF
jgi:hypothetical protein